MNLFKEVADIKTADQLNLPVPKVECRVFKAKPTETQKEMMAALSERASRIHAGLVSPSEDNMLVITSDGRKLGLDQRVIDPSLPDEPGTKVNQCVENVLQFWREGDAEKLTQLVFLDISTPKGRGKGESGFTVYDDIRQKLIANGMPPEQVAFIHDADTEIKKRELFAKVRAGQVRVLIGSTSKLGAGTNVQTRLLALHDLDCPWRPRDLTQRKGRIERQGNQNETVYVCRYVTEGSFDSYLWQTVEQKQKFISQIMTSKSPVRSCEDIDETALSFAEIKALCAGDPRIKERMDLDVEVSRLKIMRADHMSKRFQLEDRIAKYFPEHIAECEASLRGLETDMATLAAHPLPRAGFVGMEVRGERFRGKENAGAALLDAVKEATATEPVRIGAYRGFALSAYFDDFQRRPVLTLNGALSYRIELGNDPKGSLVRLDNALDRIAERVEATRNQLENLRNQEAAAREEIEKPFPYERELAEKTSRLAMLDMQLNLDGGREAQPEQDLERSGQSAQWSLPRQNSPGQRQPKRRGWGR